MTAQELGKLSAALGLIKAATGGHPLETVGKVVLRLLKDVGGPRLYEHASVSKRMRPVIAHTEKLNKALTQLKLTGGSTEAIADTTQRLERARSLLDIERAKRLRNLGLGGIGAGVGLTSALMSGAPKGYPPGYVPGYQQSAPPPGTIYVANPESR